MNRFVCGSDYKYEELMRYYDTLEDIKMNSACWQSCGVVKIKFDGFDNVISHEWVVQEDYYIDTD